MSGSSVLLYVGATTLAAAIVTLCAFQITATRMDRRRTRRPHTLEGPVPGRQSLSSIGLNTQSARSIPSSSRHQGQQAGSPGRTPTARTQKPGPSTSSTSQLPPDKETGLNSLQTIRARSAALQSDGQPVKPANLKPLTPANAPSAQRPGTRALPVREQGSATPDETSGSQQRANANRTASNPGQAGDSAGPAIIQKTPSSKRAKRTNTQTEPIETVHTSSNQAQADALADLSSLGLLDTLQSSPAGDSPLPPPTPEGGVLDIFAGLSEPEAGLHDFMDDLNDIDGGGLPTAAPKTPQKSKR